jgi:hypothetical protein
MPQPQLRQRLISKRSYVLSVLYDAKLADGFERGGNRAHQPANRDLKHGPDLGGSDVIGVNAKYMPAWRRYNGRIYLAAQERDWHSYFQNTNRVRVLIMSGLYGFLQPDESIQNYDVHLTDTHTENGQSVSSMWSDIFTESISAYINHAFQGRKVNIFNLLGDHHYVDSIHWHALPKECSVFHLASPAIEDVELLPPAGTILRHFLANANEMENIERDSIEYDISKFGAPPPGLADLKIIFESRVGLTKK